MPWLATGEARGSVALLMYKLAALMSPHALLPADVWGGGRGMATSGHYVVPYGCLSTHIVTK